MNKGVQVATGEWINFMHAGDSFYRPDVIETIYRNDMNGVDLIYGHHEVVYNEHFNVIKKARCLENLWKDYAFHHQSLFTKAVLMKNRPFDLSYKVSADYDFIYNAYVNNYSFFNSDKVIARVQLVVSPITTF
jgi:glycosyltransferase involved in cell wall biosynthesis